ncbi:MAG TPA: ABC transporter permease [Candidatus Dormibacteraeota bacterium]|nr:ABC transporter permease [Candidatus Dormibacteraeota bacterium]
MKAILTIALKDLKILARDKAGFFWVLLFPVLMAVFFGAISSGGSGNRAAMPIAVVDQDGSPYARAFLSELQKSEALRVREAGLDSARLLVRRGELVAYVALWPGAGQSFGFGGDSAKIELGLDPSRRAEAGYLRGLVTAATFSTMRGQFTSGGSGREMIRQSLASLQSDLTRSLEERRRAAGVLNNLERFMVSLDSTEGASDTTGAATAGGAGGPKIKVIDIAEEENGPRNAYEITFPSSVMWALIGVCMNFAISIVHERIRGTFLRLRLAPISRSQVLAGKGLAAFLAALGATSLLLLLAAVVFNVRITNPPALVVALVAAAFCFTGLMMLISVFGRTHSAVAGAGWAVLLVMSMTGGGMIPLIAMPAWMQSVSNFSLVKWGVLAVEGAIWRGFSPQEMALPVGILLAAGAVGFAVGARALSRSEG